MVIVIIIIVIIIITVIIMIVIIIIITIIIIINRPYIDSQSKSVVGIGCRVQLWFHRSANAQAERWTGP